METPRRRVARMRTPDFKDELVAAKVGQDTAFLFTCPNTQRTGVPWPPHICLRKLYLGNAPRVTPIDDPNMPIYSSFSGSKTFRPTFDAVMRKVEERLKKKRNDQLSELRRRNEIHKSVVREYERAVQRQASLKRDLEASHLLVDVVGDETPQTSDQAAPHPDDAGHQGPECAAAEPGKWLGLGSTVPAPPYNPFAEMAHRGGHLIAHPPPMSAAPPRSAIPGRPKPQSNLSIVDDLDADDHAIEHIHAPQRPATARRPQSVGSRPQSARCPRRPMSSGAIRTPSVSPAVASQDTFFLTRIDTALSSRPQSARLPSRGAAPRQAHVNSATFGSREPMEPTSVATRPAVYCLVKATGRNSRSIVE